MEPTDSQGLALTSYLDGAGDSATIFQAIGVEPIINCRGTFTILGGSILRPEVLRAMEAASGYFVQYDELAAGVGRHLAAVTGAEWGLIASGCAAGIKHVTTACVVQSFGLRAPLFPYYEVWVLVRAARACLAHSACFSRKYACCRRPAFSQQRAAGGCV